MTNKYCNKCKKIKLINKFPKGKTDNWCKSCHNEFRKLYKNLFNKTQKKYYQKHKEYYFNYRKINKRKANNYIKNRRKIDEIERTFNRDKHQGRGGRPRVRCNRRLG